MCFFKNRFSLLLISLIVATIGVSTSVRAIPITLDFSSGTYGSQSSNTLVNQYTQDGMIVRTLSPLDSFYSASGRYGGNLQWYKDEDYTGTMNNIIEVSAADGGLFDLFSVDIGAAFAGITFTGSNGAALGAGGSNNTRVFGADWMNLSSFTLNITLDSRILTTIDNISLNTRESVSIPEPASWLFLLVGFLGLIKWKHR